MMNREAEAANEPSANPWADIFGAVMKEKIEAKKEDDSKQAPTGRQRRAKRKEADKARARANANLELGVIPKADAGNDDLLGMLKKLE